MEGENDSRGKLLGRCSQKKRKLAEKKISPH